MLGNIAYGLLCLFPAAFFQDCISEQDLDEMNIEIIRNTLYKVNVALFGEGKNSNSFLW